MNRYQQFWDSLEEHGVVAEEAPEIADAFARLGADAADNLRDEAPDSVTDADAIVDEYIALLDYWLAEVKALGYPSGLASPAELDFSDRWRPMVDLLQDID